MAKFFSQDYAANGTNLIVQTICLGTGLVAKCFDLAIGVSIVATATSVSGITLLGASRIGDYGRVIVSELPCQNLTANGTNLIV